MATTIKLPPFSRIHSSATRTRSPTGRKIRENERTRCGRRTPSCPRNNLSAARFGTDAKGRCPPVRRAKRTAKALLQGRCPAERHPQGRSPRGVSQSESNVRERAPPGRCPGGVSTRVHCSLCTRVRRTRSSLSPIRKRAVLCYGKDAVPPAAKYQGRCPRSLHRDNVRCGMSWTQSDTMPTPISCDD